MFTSNTLGQIADEDLDAILLGKSNLTALHFFYFKSHSLLPLHFLIRSVFHDRLHVNFQRPVTLHTLEAQTSMIFEPETCTYEYDAGKIEVAFLHQIFNFFNKSDFVIRNKKSSI